MRHPDGTVLLCPDGECGGAACVRCEPLPIRYSQRCRLCNTWRISGSKACPEHRRSRRQRRQALAAFGNVLTTVGSAAPWTDVDDWAKLYRYTAKVRADTFARAERHLDERDEARAEVERLRQRVENLSQQLAAVDAITVEHGRDEMLTRTEWLHAELARRDAAVPEPPPPQEREAVREAEALLCGAVVVAKDAADAEALRRLAARPVPVGPRAEQALARARIVDGAKLEAFAAATSPMTACDCDGFGPQCFGCRAFIDAAEAAHAALQPVTPCKQ